jgi:hypothetical protein
MNIIKKEYLLLYQYQWNNFYKYFDSLVEMNEFITNPDICIRGKLKINDGNFID